MLNDVDLGEVEEKDWKCATFKQVVDLSEPAGALLKEYSDYEKLRAAGTAVVEEAVTKLLELEKKARLGGDAKSTLSLAVGLVNMLVGVKDYSLLMLNVEVLMKRRAQLKSVQLAVIKAARTAIDAAPEPERVPLIKRLRDICQGKLHVEKEFAQLSVELSTLWEAEGKLKESADLMLDVQVETIGNMSRQEKLTILLLQIRLNLDVKDYIRAAIMARKTTSRALSKPGSRHIKLQYYELMVRYYSHFDNFHYLAKCWIELYHAALDEVTQKECPDHPLVKDPSTALGFILIYVVLSSPAATTDREQTDAAAFSLFNKENDRKALLEKYSKEKAGRSIKDVVELSRRMLDKEIVHWPQYSETFKHIGAEHPVFKEKPSRWQDLHKRTTEHNIRIISKHYTRIRLQRLAQLIDLTVDETEDALCKLVTDGDIWARVDRIEGVASFVKQRKPTDVMVELKGGIDHVLAQITSACHLIHKEAVFQKTARA